MDFLPSDAELIQATLLTLSITAVVITFTMIRLSALAFVVAGLSVLAPAPEAGVPLDGV